MLIERVLKNANRKRTVRDLWGTNCDWRPSIRSGILSQDSIIFCLDLQVNFGEILEHSIFFSKWLQLSLQIVKVNLRIWKFLPFKENILTETGASSRCSTSQSPSQSSTIFDGPSFFGWIFSAISSWDSLRQEILPPEYSSFRMQSDFVHLFEKCKNSKTK